jgi:FMN phosphatase YigB (HAD superfamily)
VKVDNRTRPELTQIEALGRVQRVIFDVDGTLYEQSALRWRIVARMVAAHLTRPTNRVIRALQDRQPRHLAEILQIALRRTVHAKSGS